MVLPIALTVHSAVMLTLILLSPKTMQMHPHLLHRPGPIYTLCSSFIFAAAWAMHPWLFRTEFGETYAEIASWMFRTILDHLIPFVEILYIGFSSDAICGRAAVRRRKAMKSGHGEVNVISDEQISDDVELQHVAGKSTS